MNRPLFTGWMRPKGGSWVRVCCAATWHDCWRLLHLHDAPGPLVDKVVRVGDKHPDARRKPR